MTATFKTNPNWYKVHYWQSAARSNIHYHLWSKWWSCKYKFKQRSVQDCGVEKTAGLLL
jgi:hypothetical protein